MPSITELAYRERSIPPCRIETADILATIAVLIAEDARAADSAVEAAAGAAMNPKIWLQIADQPVKV